MQGRVTDDKGSGLPGVTIIVKGASGVGTSTDAEGNFSLTVPTGDEVLVVSSIGFVAQEISLAGRTTLTIQLVTDPATTRSTWWTACSGTPASLR